MDKLSGFITKHYKVFILVFIVVLIPALYGYQNTEVYYNLDATLPKYLESIQANDKSVSYTHLDVYKRQVPGLSWAGCV